MSNTGTFWIQTSSSEFQMLNAFYVSRHHLFAIAKTNHKWLWFLVMVMSGDLGLENVKIKLGSINVKVSPRVMTDTTELLHFPSSLGRARRLWFLVIMLRQKGRVLIKKHPKQSWKFHQYSLLFLLIMKTWLLNWWHEIPCRNLPALQWTCQYSSPISPKRKMVEWLGAFHADSS